MNRCRKLAALGAVTALLGLAGACSSEAGGSKAIGGGYGAPATVRLSGVVVGAVGAGILLQNHSDEELESVEIVINEQSDGGFRFRPAAIPPYSTQTYLTRAFKSSAGESLNPMETKPTSFAVYADTPRGRGRWIGGYENQQ